MSAATTPATTPATTTVVAAEAEAEAVAATTTPTVTGGPQTISLDDLNEETDGEYVVHNVNKSIHPVHVLFRKLVNSYAENLAYDASTAAISLMKELKVEFPKVIIVKRIKIDGVYRFQKYYKMDAISKISHVVNTKRFNNRKRARKSNEGHLVDGVVNAGVFISSTGVNADDGIHVPVLKKMKETHDIEKSPHVQQEEAIAAVVANEIEQMHYQDDDNDNNNNPTLEDQHQHGTADDILQGTMILNQIDPDTITQTKQI